MLKIPEAMLLPETFIFGAGSMEIPSMIDSFQNCLAALKQLFY
jgi:hypothetical protein